MPNSSTTRQAVQWLQTGKAPVDRLGDVDDNLLPRCLFSIGGDLGERATVDVPGLAEGFIFVCRLAD